MPHRRTIVPALILILACSSKDDAPAPGGAGSAGGSAHGEVAAAATLADSVTRLITLAGESEAAGDSVTAREYLAAAAGLDSADAALQLRVARADDALGNASFALAEYRRFLALNPSGVVADEARRRVRALESAGTVAATPTQIRARSAARASAPPARATTPVPGAAVAAAPLPATPRPRVPAARPTAAPAAGEETAPRTVPTVSTGEVDRRPAPVTAASESATAAAADSAREDRRRRDARQTATGAAIGAVAGAVIGGTVDRSARGAAIGAGVGAVLGAGAAEMRQATESVRRADSARREEAMRRADSLRKSADSLRKVADSLRTPDSLRKARGARRDSAKADTLRDTTARRLFR